VNYSYINDKLEGPFNSIMKDVQMTLMTLSYTNGPENANSRISDIIQADQGKMIETLLQPYTRNSQEPVTTAPAFIKYIVGEYRGEKQERTYRFSDIPAIEKNAMRTSEIKNRCTAFTNEAQRLYGRVRNLERELTPNTDPKVITQVKENARKATVLYNVYISLIKSYFELRLEQSMNYRLILARFYQMPRI